MGKFILGSALILLVASQSFGAEQYGKDVKEISVKNEEIFIVTNNKPYFWMGCLSQCAESTRGAETIKLGDTITHKEHSITVGVIRYLEHTEEVGSHFETPVRGCEGCVFATIDTNSAMSKKIHPHKADCIIASDESNLPDSGKCNNTWIVVEGCAVLSR